VTGSMDVAQRYGKDDVSTQGRQAGGLVRSTVMMNNVPRLDTTSPVSLCWVPVRGYSRPAASTDADVPGRLTLTMTICVVSCGAKDLKALQ